LLRRGHLLPLLWQAANCVFSLVAQLCEIFIQLPTSEELPEYHAVIKRPMDIATVERRVVNKHYVEHNDFVKDCELIFTNAQKYNLPESMVWEDAQQLLLLTRSVAKTHRAALRKGVTAAEKRRLSGNNTTSLGAGASKRPKSSAGGNHRPERRLSKSEELAHLRRIEDEYGGAGAAVGTAANETGHLLTTLRQAWQAGLLKPGCNLHFDGLGATMNDAGRFLLVNGEQFPSRALMRCVIAKGGFGTNGWKPIRIGNQSIATIRDALTKPAKHQAHGRGASSGDALGNGAKFSPHGSVKQYSKWLAHQRRKWASQTESRSLSRQKPEGVNVAEDVPKTTVPATAASSNTTRSTEAVETATAVDMGPRAVGSRVSQRIGAYVVSSEAYVRTAEMCMVCCSSGLVDPPKDPYLDTFAYCSTCSEPYHFFCADIAEKDMANCTGWCCKMCQVCCECRSLGVRDELLTCACCKKIAHGSCLESPMPYMRSSMRWVCDTCVKCESCGATEAGPEADAKWMFDFTMCQDCGQNRMKGNYCPVCSKVYRDDDWECTMMCCDNCERWLHATCDGVCIQLLCMCSGLVWWGGGGWGGPVARLGSPLHYSPSLSLGCLRRLTIRPTNCSPPCQTSRTDAPTAATAK